MRLMRAVLEALQRGHNGTVGGRCAGWIGVGGTGYHQYNNAVRVTHLFYATDVNNNACPGRPVSGTLALPV